LGIFITQERWWQTPSSPRTIASNMLKNEGVTAFYTGLTAGLTRQVVYTGARLGLFDKFTGMAAWCGSWVVVGWL